MFCFPNTRQEILFPSNLVLFTLISGQNQLRRKEKVSGSPRTSVGKTKHLGPRRAAPRPAPPRPHVSVFCLKTEFFSPVWPTVNTYPVKRIFSKRSPEWRFLKTPAFRLRVDGHKLRFSNTMMPYILCFQLEACSVRDAIAFPLF